MSELEVAKPRVPKPRIFDIGGLPHIINSIIAKPYAITPNADTNHKLVDAAVG